MSEPTGDAQQTSFLEVASLVLSVYVLGALACQTFVALDPANDSVLRILDASICLFFLFEFGYRLWLAENKYRFIAWNWIDLISSIPAVDMLRWGRLFRILRILRAVRSTKVLIKFLFRNRKDGTLKTVLLISLVLVIFSSVAVLNLEDQPESNIKTPSDAIWWSFVSLTTVGYGDKYPVTPGGRLVAVLLVTMGVGLFGTLSGYIASYFLEWEQQAQESEIKQLTLEVAKLNVKLETLEKLLHANETRNG